MAPYVLQIRSGVVDACVEAALFLVSLLLCLCTLDHIRALCAEHKLRRGGVIPLHRRSLTRPERAASLLILIGLPLIALATSLGRNGETVPIYNSLPAVVDVWDTDLDVSGPNLLFDTGGYGVLSCGTGASDATPQAAVVGRKNATGGKVYCPGQFNQFIDGFVLPLPVVVKPPRELYPANNKEALARPFGELAKVDDWRAQCSESEAGVRCYTWKWTVDSFSVCPSYTNTTKPGTCSTFNLAKGAPEIDTDKAVEKVAFGSRNGAGLELIIAHLTVSKFKAMEVEVEVRTRQVTVITTWSWVGVLAVLLVSFVAALAAWAVSVHAKRRRGYSMPLSSYSGMANYAATLQDRHGYSTGRSHFNSDPETSASGDAIKRTSGPSRTSNLARPHIRLVEGSGEYAGLVSVGRNPEVSGFAVQKGRIGTGIASVDDAGLGNENGDENRNVSEASLSLDGL